MFGIERWQYQVKAEPFPAAIPILWGWASETTILLRVNELVQYQMRAFGEPPTIPSFDWFHQQTDVIRPLHQTQPGWYASGREEEIIEVDLDWFLAPPDVILPRHQVDEGHLVLGQPPSIPSFDWFVPPADVIRPPEQLVPEQYALGNAELLPILWASETTAVLGEDQFQYQGKAEPLFVEEPVPSFGWFQQEPDVIRLEHQVDEGHSVLGTPPIIPAFDWEVEPADVVRPPSRLIPEQLVLGAVPVIPSFEWWIQEPDLRGPPEILEGDIVVPLIVVAPTPDFGWFTFLEDPIRRVDEVIVEGISRPIFPPSGGAQTGVAASTAVVFLGPVVLYQAKAEPLVPIVPALVDFGWWHQQEDVIYPSEQLVPEQLVLGTIPIIPAFDWFHQQTDVTRPLHQVRLGIWVSGREEEIIEVDLDWFIEEPDPILPLHQTRSGFFVLGRPPVVPAFDWWQQETDVVQPPKRLVPEAFALVEFRVPIPLDFDWWVQEPDIFRPLPLVRPGLFVTGTLPIIPSFDWWAQEPNVFKAPPHPEGFIARLDPVAPPTVFLEWFQIQENPILPFVWLLGKETRPLLVLAAPPGEVVFVIRDCIALSALEQNSVLPLPSTFIRAEDIVTPSTFVEDEDTVTPSTWIQEGKSTLWDDLSS